jgi:hypothetical protein
MDEVVAWLEEVTGKSIGARRTVQVSATSAERL